MGLRVPYDRIEKDIDTEIYNPIVEKIAPSIITKPTVSDLDPFELRKINPLNFSRKELSILWQRFFMEFDAFTIYFLEDAIKEKYGFPTHLREIGKQLIAYHRYNLIVAPRGFSKSTIISAAFPLREIVYRMKEYIIIVSETTDIASDFTETIRFELENNERLKLFYGKFRSKKDESDSTEKWTTSDIICKSEHPQTGRPFYTRLRARGSGQQIRGKKHRHQRPDLLIFDDMESRLNTETADQRTKLKKWFNRDALKIMDRYDSETGKGQVVVAGTIVHPESRLNALKKNTEESIRQGKEAIWDMLFYRAAEDPETFENPLWDKRFGKDELRRERETAIANDDLAGFLQEFFNEPVDETEKKFKDMHFVKRYDQVSIESHFGVSVLRYENQIYPCNLSAGLDLGGWEDRGSDYTAIVIGASIYDHINGTHRAFPLEVFNERIDPSQVIDLMFDLSERYNTKDTYGNITKYLPWTVETNAFQTVLYHFLNREMARRRRFTVNIANERHEYKSKKGRILSLVPVFASGYYIFGNHLEWVVREFLNYGLASDMHDDIQDAFEKMHSGLTSPSVNEHTKLNNIMPLQQRIIEPPKVSEGNWYTL